MVDGVDGGDVESLDEVVVSTGLDGELDFDAVDESSEDVEFAQGDVVGSELGGLGTGTETDDEDSTGGDGGMTEVELFEADVLDSGTGVDVEFVTGDVVGHDGDPGLQVVGEGTSVVFVLGQDGDPGLHVVADELNVLDSVVIGPDVLDSLG